MSSLAGTAYYFACHRWLSRDEDDGLIERDLFPGEAELHDLDVQYTAEVFTSDITGAGTDADVSVVLFGHLGDSGPQSLNVSCCAVFCHAVPCCAVPCCAVLCYAVMFAEGCCLCHPMLITHNSVLHQHLKCVWHRSWDLGQGIDGLQLGVLS